MWERCPSWISGPEVGRGAGERADAHQETRRRCHGWEMLGTNDRGHRETEVKELRQAVVIVSCAVERAERGAELDVEPRQRLERLTHREERAGCQLFLVSIHVKP